MLEAALSKPNVLGAPAEKASGRNVTYHIGGTKGKPRHLPEHPESSLAARRAKEAEKRCWRTC